METMLMQNFGGQTKNIIVFLKVAYSTFRSSFDSIIKEKYIR